MQARRFLQELFLDSSFDAVSKPPCTRIVHSTSFPPIPKKFTKSKLQLYEEPTAILKAAAKPAEIRQPPYVPNPSDTPAVPSPSCTPASKPSEAKVNGRLPPAPANDHHQQQQQQLSSLTEEITAIETLADCVVLDPKKSSLNLRVLTESHQQHHQQHRRSDEKIIAEILKPEERIRLATAAVAKSSDKMLRPAAAINNAIGLDMLDRFD